MPTCDRSEIRGTAEDFFFRVFRKIFAVPDSVLLHRRLNFRRRDITVSRNTLARCNARHLRIKRLVQFIFADPVYNNVLKNCAARLCRALRRVNRLCSRTVSGTANMSGHGSTLCSPTEEKILCRSPYFAAVTCRQSAPDPPRERGDSQEGGNRRCLPSCAPARRQRKSPPRGAARSRRPQTAHFLAKSQRKPPAR